MKVAIYGTPMNPSDTLEQKFEAISNNTGNFIYIHAIRQLLNAEYYYALADYSEFNKCYKSRFEGFLDFLKKNNLSITDATCA